MADVGLFGAYVAGLFGAFGVVWTTARARSTAAEIEALKASLGRETDALKKRLDDDHQRRWKRREDALARVNEQLRLLYGPLHALSRAGHESWMTFRRRYRPGGAFWRPDSEPTKEEAEAWRSWMTRVFMPINTEMERLILTQSHLIEGESLDDSMAALCAHVASYKTVVDRWGRQDFTEHTAPILFPEKLPSEVEAVYRMLRERQTKLLTFASFDELESPTKPAT